MTLVRLWYATILDIKSPSEFSVRLAAAEEEFFFFKERLNEHYKRHWSSLKLDIVQVCSLKAGDNIVVFYDSRWSRALVQSTNQYQVKVWLLDYGQTLDGEERVASKTNKQTNVLEMDELYTLDDEFSKIKPFAIRCHLGNLEEVVTPHWLAAATQEMENMKEHYGDEVQIVQLGDSLEPTDENDNVIFPDENGGCFKSLPVNVLWSYTESSPLEPSVQKNVNLLDNLKIMEVFESLDAEIHLNEIDDELMDSLTEAADLLTTSDDETVSSKRAVKKVENDPNFRWLNPEIPSQRRFLARCTHVDDSGQIYLQLESNKSRINSVHDDLASKYMGSKNDGIKLKEGSECIARWRDGRWYRGRILSYGPFKDRPAISDEVLVLFVDFGNTSVIKKKNIRATLSYKNVPIQAARVVLSDVAPKNGGQWSPGCLDFIHQVTNSDRHVDHSPVDVAVLENDKMPLKVIIQIKDKKGVWINLSEMLVAMGEGILVAYVESSSSLAKRWEENSHGVGFAIARTSTSNPVEVPSKPVEVSLPRDLQFPVPEDLLQHAQVGGTYKCKLASVVAYNKVFVHPVVDELVVAGVPGPPSNLSSLAIRYNHMWKQLQEEAPRMPPVINPTKGLPVAAKFKVEGSREKLWYRGVIQDVSTCEIVVIFVDFDGVPFSVESKEVVRLPEFAEAVPVIGMEIELGVVADDDDEEVATVVMGECLWKQEDPLFVQLISTNPRLAHIVDAAGKPVYSSLQEEGFIFLKTEDDVLSDLKVSADSS